MFHDLDRTWTRNWCARHSSGLRMLLIAIVTTFLEMGSVGQAICAQAAEFDASIELTKLDSGVTHYATFQSHNQKVLANQYGIFTTHIRDRDMAYQAQSWRLSRSTDGGKTFATLFERTDATNPPVIETDRDGNVYLIRVDFRDGNAYLYRFPSASDFRDPIISTIPGGAAGKYAMMLDDERQQIYFVAHNNTFHRISFDGTVNSRVDLLKPGNHAELQYPLLSLSTSGQLHFGWTTVKHGEYLYWDIHHMMSADQGNTWRDLKGRSIQIPVVADDQGAADRISSDDEFDSHTWLSSMMVSRGKVHFAYMAQTKPPRQHYIRYDLASGDRDQHLYPQFQGNQIKLLGLDGFFVKDPLTESRIYFVGNDSGRIACLRSDDNGETWSDYARTEPAYAPYAIGGFRTVREGKIIGTFTQQRASDDVLDFRSDVYFFRISINR